MDICPWHHVPHPSLLLLFTPLLNPLPKSFAHLAGDGAGNDLLYISDELCDHSKFYRGYAQVFHSRLHERLRSPSPVVSLEKTGFLDLRSYSGVLCINGPAFLYLDLVSIYDNQSTTEISQVFTSATRKIFIHECFSFNRHPRAVYKAGRTWLTTRSEIFGNRFYGLYLLTSPIHDYRQADFVMFNEPNGGHAPDREILDGASIALVMSSVKTSAFCFHIDEHNVDGLISGNFRDGDEPRFCWRNMRSKGGVDVDIPWRKDVMINQVKWGSCGDGLFSLVGGKNEEESEESWDFNKPVPNILRGLRKIGEISRFIYQDFKKDRMKNPVKVNSISGDLMRNEKFPLDYDWFAHLPTDYDAPVGRSLELPEYRRYFGEFSPQECIPIPKPSSIASFSVCKRNTHKGCSLLNHVLTIESTDWESANSLKRSSWRKPILHVIQQIYNKVCPQVGEMFVAAVTRIFEFHLDSAVNSAEHKLRFEGTNKSFWNHIELDLETCERHAKPLPLSWVHDGEKLEKKGILQNLLLKLTSSIERNKSGEFFSELKNSLRSQIENELDSVDLQNSYKITLTNFDDLSRDEIGLVEMENYAFVEAAEIDYNLDWGIDFFWKIISTVIGYCYFHFDPVELGSFLQVYDYFTQDFLDYVGESWMFDEDFEVYDQLLGSFPRTKGYLWIDACNNGAYIWRKIVGLRPLRPLYLTHGDSDLSNNKKAIPNFFIVHPNFHKVSSKMSKYEHPE